MYLNPCIFIRLFLRVDSYKWNSFIKRYTNFTVFTNIAKLPSEMIIPVYTSITVYKCLFLHTFTNTMYYTNIFNFCLFSGLKNASHFNLNLLTSGIKGLSVYLLSVYISFILTCVFMALLLFMLLYIIDM